MQVDAASSPAAGAVVLFNGVDFSGWDRYLGKPSDAEPALGIDNDGSPGAFDFRLEWAGELLPLR